MVALRALVFAAVAALFASPAYAMDVDEDVRSLMEGANYNDRRAMDFFADIDARDLQESTEAPTAAPTPVSTSGAWKRGPSSTAFATIATVAAALTGAVAMA